MCFSKCLWGVSWSDVMWSDVIQVQLFPSFYSAVFCEAETPLTAQTLSKFFTIKLSEQQEKLNKETPIVSFWRHFLVECEGTDAKTWKHKRSLSITILWVYSSAPLSPPCCLSWEGFHFPAGPPTLLHRSWEAPSARPHLSSSFYLLLSQCLLGWWWQGGGVEGGVLVSSQWS